MRMNLRVDRVQRSAHYLAWCGATRSNGWCAPTFASHIVRRARAARTAAVIASAAARAAACAARQSARRTATCDGFDRLSARSVTHNRIAINHLAY